MIKNSSDVTLFIDPVSHHFLNNALFNIHNAKLNGDNILAPYVYLQNWFADRGIKVYTADYLMRNEVCSTKNIYISMGITNNYRRLAQRRDVVLSAFFALECPIVEPSLYKELANVQRYFKRVFSSSDNESLMHFLRYPLRCKRFYIPQSYESAHEEIWCQEKRGFLVMINANKLPRVYWHELYTERMRAVEYFSSTGEIDLYGVGWNGPSYRVGKSIIPATIRRIQRYLVHQWHRVYPDPLLCAAQRAYRGPAISKAETLGKYTFALCFENIILKGWITEKIFDCFFVGTIPIYWGAPDIQEYIPPECFIDMRNFKNYEELKNYLKSLTSEDVLRYKENARKYLESPQFRPFSKESFVELFCRILEKDASVKLL